MTLPAPRRGRALGVELEGRGPPEAPCVPSSTEGSGGSWGGQLGRWWWLWGAGSNQVWDQLSLTSGVSLSTCKMGLWLPIIWTGELRPRGAEWCV